MNKQQVKGAVERAVGKAQEKLGRAIDSPTQEAKGIGKQIKGQARKSVGDAKEVLKDAGKA